MSGWIHDNLEYFYSTITMGGWICDNFVSFYATTTMSGWIHDNFVSFYSMITMGGWICDNFVSFYATTTMSGWIHDNFVSFYSMITMGGWICDNFVSFYATTTMSGLIHGNLEFFMPQQPGVVWFMTTLHLFMPQQPWVAWFMKTLYLFMAQQTGVTEFMVTLVVSHVSCYLTVNKLSASCLRYKQHSSYLVVWLDIVLIADLFVLIIHDSSLKQLTSPSLMICRLPWSTATCVYALWLHCVSVIIQHHRTVQFHPSINTSDVSLSAKLLNCSNKSWLNVNRELVCQDRLLSLHTSVLTQVVRTHFTCVCSSWPYYVCTMSYLVWEI